MLNLFTICLVSTGIAAFSTLIIIKLAYFLNILDYPTSTRKIHKKPIPLLGGVAIYLSFFLVIFFIYYLDPSIFRTITVHELQGVFLGATILMISGIIDDKYDIGAFSIVGPVVAVIIVLLFGIRIEVITNPFGGVVDLTTVSIISFIISFVWLMGMIYTTKLLDGLDGLVGGLTSIGAFMIFMLSISERYFQLDAAVLSIVLFGCCLGFLMFNFNPAKIFLGESGSVFTGYIWGILAIISGSKIATVLLVIGIPVMDTCWVIFRRVKSRKSIKHADKKHFHHRLIDVGLTQRQAVLFYYLIAFVFGLSTLFLQSIDKIILFIILVFFMLAIGWVVHLFNNQRKV